MDEKKKSLIQFLSSLALLMIAYIPMFRWMIDRWVLPESYYGHGMLIPLVSGYVLWQRKDALKEAKISSEFFGLIIVAGCLITHLLCALLKIYFVSGFSFVLAIFGLVLFFLGKDMAKKVIFPVFFLFAMIPLPLVLISNLTVKLKLIAAQIATLILNNIGFPAVRDGSIIAMPNSYIAVEAPCSGLRSLISLLTLGVVFAFAAKVSYLKKGVLLAASVPIAMATNVLRIIMLATVNDLYGEKIAMGFFHDFSGFFVFAFAFAGLYIVVKALEPKGIVNE